MPLNVTLGFPGSAGASAVIADGFKVQRYELRDTMSELFELTIEVLSSDLAISEADIVGHPVVVDFGDEPFLKEIQGIVRRMVQLTAVAGGDSKYEWVIVPPLWLTTRRSDSRIFQNLSVPETVAAVMSDPRYGGRIPKPSTHLGGQPPKREYTVQYGETDFDFISRLLADEGLTFFFDHAHGSAFTLVEDTSVGAAPLPGPIPFSDPSNLNPIVASNLNLPHIQTMVITSNVETSEVTIRDFDFEKPEFILEGNQATKTGTAFQSEPGLEAYSYEVGKFTQTKEGATRAQRMVEALRTTRRRFLCTSNFTAPPGTRFSLADHPRAELAQDYLVVGTRTLIDFGAQRIQEIEMIELVNRFRPARRPRAHFHGMHTAIVTGADGEEIDVDKFGRVTVEFRWDRRDTHSGGATRRVRVAQGWAGAGFGFVMLPRVNEEVIVTYLDGNLDEPIIVGRVHNAFVTSPLNLPADKTQSIWRSKSSPKSDGFNMILMEDLAGQERLEFRAERDLVEFVGHDAHRTVVGNSSTAVSGDGGTAVKGDQSLNVTGTLTVKAGVEILVTTPILDVTASTSIHMTTAEHRDKSTNHILDANGIYLHGKEIVQVAGSKFHVFCDEILLKSGGASILMSGGDIIIDAPGTVDIKGGMIKLNS